MPDPDLQIADIEARSMRRLHNQITFCAPLGSDLEIAFVRAYQNAYALWQELGGPESEIPKILRPEELRAI